MVKEWINGAIRLADNETEVIQKREMLQFLAVYLCEQCTYNRVKNGQNYRCSKRFRVVVSSTQSLKRIYEKLWTGLMSGRLLDRVNTWMSQRDKAQNLNEFEQWAFKYSR